MRTTYNPDSETASIMSGILDAFSAGILIYTGLVEVCFVFSPSSFTFTFTFTFLFPVLCPYSSLSFNPPLTPPSLPPSLPFLPLPPTQLTESYRTKRFAPLAPRPRIPLQQRNDGSFQPQTRLRARMYARWGGDYGFAWAVGLNTIPTSYSHSILRVFVFVGGLLYAHAHAHPSLTFQDGQ